MTPLKLQIGRLGARVSGVAHWVRNRPRTAVAAVMLLSTLAVYAPFATSMDKVFRYWDGPQYLFVAKTLYVIPDGHPFEPLGLTAKYFASHLPLYPLLIRGLSLATLGDYPLAMLLATVATSVASAVLFLELLRSWQLVSAPLWTATLFCFLPPRWVIYHSVGATEPLFYCFTFAALLALRRERHGWVPVFVGLASLTRITGLLLVPVFGLIYLSRRDLRRLATLPLSGLGVVALFALYGRLFGDFFAYSSWNLDRLGMLSTEPLEGFLRSAGSGDYRATELYFWLYFVYGVGVLALWRTRELFWYGVVFWVFGAFVIHRDLTRYFLALSPFALLVGFQYLVGRERLLAGKAPGR